MVMNVTSPDVERGDSEMDFNEAKTALKNGYIVAGFEVVHDGDTEFTLKYHDRLFVVTGEDIDEYASTASLRAVSQVEPVECSMVNASYREQAVQPLDPIRWRYLPPLELGFIFGEPSATDLYVTVGAASDEFANFFRFDPTYMEICLERLSRAPISDEPTDIRQGFYKPPTIQVHNISENTVKGALKTSSEIIEYCLFELSYLKHIPVGVAEEWPARRRLEDDNFKFGDEFEGNKLPLPPATFQSDLLQFYQLGTSSRIPVLQYWSFYQVLEYFFVSASDEHLHLQMASRLKDPRFKPSSAQLDRLVQDVIDHLDQVDEVLMLKSVLDKYVDAEELIAFIRQYEAYLGDDMYTRRRRVFGEDVQVKLSADSVMEQVARTVMAIRQTLVFSPDRFSRTARNITFEQLTDTVRLEIPLMKFLAERVIIGSAS
jgi:hypothetical protein